MKTTYLSLKPQIFLYFYIFFFKLKFSKKKSDESDDPMNHRFHRSQN